MTFESRRARKTCPNCGKYVTTGGSVTSWLFGIGKCHCRSRQPGETSESKVSVLERLKSKGRTPAKGLSSKEIASIFGESYEVLDLVGEGGMASVFKVRNTVDGGIYAVKMLREDLAREPDAVKRFKQEVLAAVGLEHPNLVPTYEVGETIDGTPFFVMDFIDGRNLGSLIKGHELGKWNDAIGIIIPVCEAIEHAHSKGVVHRDLKPSNVLVTTDGVVKVVDFGIAKLMKSTVTGGTSSSLTQTGDVFGSPLYMSPEQCLGESADARSDIYALGCLMYELISGAPPFQRSNSIKIIFGHLNEKPSRLHMSRHAEDQKLPPGLEAVVMHCLEKKPADRYQTIADLLVDLRRILDGKPPVNVGITPRQRNLLAKAAVFAGILFVGAGITFVSMNQQPDNTSTGAVVVANKSVNLSANKAAKERESQTLISRFSQEIKTHPDDSYWYIMRGTTYRETGDYANALNDFSIAIQNSPSSAEAYRGRGWTYNLLRDWDKGIADNSKAIELNPKFADAYIGRSIAYLNKGNNQKAFDDANKAVELNPHNPMAFHNRACARYNLGDFKNTMSDCNTAVQLNPDDPLLRILRSRVAEKLGQYQKGIDDLTFIIELNPNDVPRRVERAFLFNQIGKFDQALTDANIASNLDSHHIGAWIARGSALAGQNRTEDAIREFDRGLASDPRNGDLLKRRGDVLVKMQQYGKAIESYDAALKYWPNMEEARKARASVADLLAKQRKTEEE